MKDLSCQLFICWWTTFLKSLRFLIYEWFIFKIKLHVVCMRAKSINMLFWCPLETLEYGPCRICLLLARYIGFSSFSICLPSIISVIGSLNLSIDSLWFIYHVDFKQSPYCNLNFIIWYTCFLPPFFFQFYFSCPSQLHSCFTHFFITLHPLPCCHFDRNF